MIEDGSHKILIKNLKNFQLPYKSLLKKSVGFFYFFEIL